MSMKRLAILAAVGHSNGGLNGTYTILGANMTTSPGGGSHSGRGNGSIHGNVNVLLGGAMLSGVILVVVFVCYCCHRSIRKNSQPYSPYWREPEVPLEVFTLAAQAHCYESAGLFLANDVDQYGNSAACIPRVPTPGPPPAYETVIAAEKDKHSITSSPRDEQFEMETNFSNNNNHNSSSINNNNNSNNKIQRTNSNHNSGVLRDELPSDETGLPTYEAALRLEAGDYV